MPRQTGTYRTTTTAGEAVRAFIPHPLPPADPPFEMDDHLSRLHAEAMTALARLGVVGDLVPSADWFLYGFVRKEAVLTSQIEGTQATLRDVLMYEATEQAERPEDVEEVCNYVEALTFARRELARARGLPLSTRLLCESHKRLMRGARGADKRPCAIRRSQNWIGGTRPGHAIFVPPPPEEVPDAMAALEKWIHADDSLPPLVRAGLAHVQFETIHPFLDGNGRIGRLFIALLIEHWRLMRQPLLYISVAFRRRQREYYTRLAAVRTEGDWEGWTAFYLECACEAARDGVEVAQGLFALLDKDKRRLTASPRATVAAVQLLDALPEHPIITARRAAKLLGVTAPTARKALDILVDLGILRETTGRQRDRAFAYHQYLQTLTGGDA